MKILFISDTHGQHSALSLPGADMVVHAGDLSGRGGLDELKAFMGWFGGLPHKYKIFIAGNHDFMAEQQPEIFEEIIPSNCIYLNDSGVEIEGIKIWGSPVSPFYFNWAFNRQRGPEIRQHWALIPEDTDLLITHGPPFRILDKCKTGEEVGCNDLLDRIRLIKPKVHVFGHIHEGYGAFQDGETLHINASVLNKNYLLVNKPIPLNWENMESKSIG